MTRNFDVFFDLRLNKALSKQSWGCWFKTLSRPLWRHYNANDTSVNNHGYSTRVFQACLMFWCNIVTQHVSTNRCTIVKVNTCMNCIWRSPVIRLSNSWRFVGIHSVGGLYIVRPKATTWNNNDKIRMCIARLKLTDQSAKTVRKRHHIIKEHWKSVVVRQHCSVNYVENNCALQWRHNERDDVFSNHRHLGCLLRRLFRRRSKKISKLCVTGLC